jgi:aryl-phospho-beta-D-glucosidase BglC (GH1 family)
LVIKGVSYYGFEQNTFCPAGLWGNPLNQILNFVKENNFNAIRIPFSLELVKNNPKTDVDCHTNPTLCHLPALSLMEAFIDQ